MDTVGEYTPLSGLFPSVSTCNRKSTLKCCHAASARTPPRLLSPSQSLNLWSLNQLRASEGSLRLQYVFQSAYIPLPNTTAITTHTLDTDTERAKSARCEVFILQVSQKRKLSGDLIEAAKPMDVCEESQEEKSSWLGIHLKLWTPGRRESTALGLRQTKMVMR